MRIAVLCATRRGYLFLQKLQELVPGCEFVVFSFREEPWEPPFLDDIRDLTLKYGGQFFETKNVNSQRWLSFWSISKIDLIFMVSWRYLVPPAIYQKARLGAFVFHDSLLPTYRGFAPTVWAMINGESETGVTLFEIAENVDEGAIIAQERVAILPDDTIATVMERVTQTYLQLLENNIQHLIKGTALRFPQDHTVATYTCKRLPEDNLIHWQQTAEQIYNLIRATSKPYPGAYTYLAGEKLYIWAAQRLPNARQYVGAIPGRVVEIWRERGTVILTGDQPLLLTSVQLEGGEIVCAAEILNSPSQTLSAEMSMPYVRTISNSIQPTGLRRHRTPVRS